MATIKITRTGPTPVEIEKQIRFQFISVQEGLQDFALLARNHMRNTIKTSKRRKGGSRDNLEKAIKVHVIQNTQDVVDIGVGKVTLLNVIAPYWMLLNNGGMSPLALQGKTLYGAFDGTDRPDPALAGTGRGTQSFIESRFGATASFPMTPRNPIAPVNYIEKAFAWANTVIRVHYSGWLRRTRAV